VGAWPSGQVTFCFTDIEGSTALMSRVGERLYASLLERHREILRAAWARCGGVEVNTEGDGCFVAFADAGAALEACRLAQRLLGTERWPSGATIRVRMGLHSGEATPDARGDYSALAVQQTARVAACGHGGQVVVSGVSAVAASAGGLRSLGRYRVRDFPEPVELLQLVGEGLVEEFPPLRDVGSLDLFAGVELPSWLRFPGSLPFVGRHDHVDAGLCVLDDAIAGRSRALFVGGEAGVGKSRLVGEIARGARRRGMVVVGGRCDPEMTNPFGPFTEAFRQVVRAVDVSVLPACLGRWPEELARIVPELPDVVPGLGEPLVSDPGTERWRLLDAIVSALAGLANVGGLALVVDDLHWATQATIGVIRHLLRADGVCGLALLGTYRDTELDAASPCAQLIADLGRVDGTGNVVLAGLDDAAMVALVHAAAGLDVDEVGRAVAEALSRQTAGNPFFAGEVLSDLLQRGSLVGSDSRWLVVPDLAELTLPARVRDVIRQRVGLLGDGAQVALQAGSAVGSEFEVDVIQAVTGAQDTVDALEQAAHARLVVEVSADRWRFVHALVRSALYDQMSRSRRSRVHRLIADTLEAGDRPDAAMVAHHWSLASGPDAATKAARWFVAAGDDAMQRLAPDEAAALYQAALDHGARAGRTGFGDVERVTAQIGLGTAQRRAARPTSSETLMTAARDAMVLHRPDLAGTAVVNDTRGFWNTLGQYDDERVSLIEEILGLLPSDDGPLRARLLATLAAELLFHPRSDERFGLADEALALARRVGDDATTFDVAVHRVLSTASPERLDGHWRDTIEIVALANNVGDPHRNILAMMLRYFVGIQSGHLDEVAEQPGIATVAASELGQPMLIWLAGAMRAGLLIFQARLDEAETLATEALTTGQAAGEDDAILWYSGQLTAIRYQQDRMSELIDLLAGFVAANPQLPVWQGLLAMSMCELERFDDARNALERLSTDRYETVPRDQFWIPTLCFAAEACRYVGDVGQARLLYDLLKPWRHLSAAVSVFSIGSVERTLGVLATQLHEHDTAERHLLRAIAKNERDGSPLWAATARLDLADLYLRRRRDNDVERFHEVVGRACDDVKNLGANRVTRRTNALLAAL
jgi:eukaryotic-like serine/threonine-protein kinase